MKKRVPLCLVVCCSASEPCQVAMRVDVSTGLIDGFITEHTALSRQERDARMALAKLADDWDCTEVVALLRGVLRNHPRLVPDRTGRGLLRSSLAAGNVSFATRAEHFLRLPPETTP